TRPALSESLPRVADTVCVDWGVSCTGRAPKRSTVARFLASFSVKLPVIWALLSKLETRLGWIWGADSTVPSSTIARLPLGHTGSLATHFLEMSRTFLPPSPVKVTLTVQSPASCGGVAWAVFTTLPTALVGPRM